jgi:hypothetical protein
LIKDGADPAATAHAPDSPGGPWQLTTLDAVLAEQKALDLAWRGETLASFRTELLGIAASLSRAAR